MRERPSGGAAGAGTAQRPSDPGLLVLPVTHLAQAMASAVGAPGAAQGSPGDSRRTGDGDGPKDNWQAGAPPRGSSLPDLG